MYLIYIQVILKEDTKGVELYTLCSISKQYVEEIQNSKKAYLMSVSSRPLRQGLLAPSKPSIAQNTTPQSNTQDTVLQVYLLTHMHV